MVLSCDAVGSAPGVKIADPHVPMGMVTDLADTPALVRPAAHTLARRIATLAPFAVPGTKRALNVVTRQRAAEVVDTAFAFGTEALIADDLEEAVTA